MTRTAPEISSRKVLTSSDDLCMVIYMSSTTFTTWTSENYGVAADELSTDAQNALLVAYDAGVAPELDTYRSSLDGLLYIRFN